MLAGVLQYNEQLASSRPDLFAIATELRTKCGLHFIHVTNTGTGIGEDSCCAAVAIDQDWQYDTAPGGEFSVVYGNSRMFTGLDRDVSFITAPKRIRPGRGLFSSSPLEEHAEQIAIRVSEDLNLNFHTFNVNFHTVNGGVNCIYVQLPPCNNCTAWLAARPETENWLVFWG